MKGKPIEFRVHGIGGGKVMSARTIFSRGKCRWREPDGLERGIFALLTQIEFPGRAAVREQLRDVKVSDLDDNGSLALLASGPAASVVNRIPVELSYVDRDGVSVHVLLHVGGMLVDEFEIYREDSGKVDVNPNHAEVRIESNSGSS